ncbi:MAG: hypothetical protein M1150_04295 [Patescibacteria group bacterium]|nr:hypothetical protein [Patescibacteria group bacterium]
MFTKPTEEILEALRKGVSQPKVKDRPAKEEAAEKLHRENGATGRIGIPRRMLFACLASAGRHVTYSGRKKMSTADSTLLPAFLRIQERFIPFGLRDEPGLDFDNAWEVDIQKGQHESAGRRIMIVLVRPRFDRWGFEATVSVKDSEVDDKSVRQLFEVAGSMYGIGAFGPRNSGDFGMFNVVDWKKLS